MNISNIGIDYKKLQEEGLITVRAHEQFPFRILNYTPKAQYDRLWDRGVSLCRGLIIDKQGEIIARPFPKFFNLEEIDYDLPEESFIITDKIDGSLGIMYWFDCNPYISTRGSFHSEQADMANIMLRDYHINHLDSSLTYLFEIVYPQNRIVVDYGDREELVLIAVINTETGREIPINSVNWPYKTKYYGDGLYPHGIRSKYQNDTAEGVVLFYPKSQFRVKVKWDRYVEMHRAKFGLNNIIIWEACKANRYEELRRAIPEEFYEWADGEKIVLDRDFIQLKNTIPEVVRDIVSGLDVDYTRKEFASWVLKYDYSALIFKWYDGKLKDEDIWDYVKPKQKKGVI